MFSVSKNGWSFLGAGSGVAVITGACSGTCIGAGIGSGAIVGTGSSTGGNDAAFSASFASIDASIPATVVEIGPLGFLDSVPTCTFNSNLPLAFSISILSISGMPYCLDSPYALKASNLSDNAERSNFPSTISDGNGSNWIGLFSLTAS